MKKVIVNFSGGKDSTVAILETLKVYPKEEILLCYQDTGADYLETDTHVKAIAEMLDLSLVVLKRDEDYWGLTKRVGWPMPDTRYCTKKLKQDMIRHWVSKHRSDFGDEIVIVTGLRAEESPARAKLGEWAIDDHLTTKKQTVKFWAPCLRMGEQEVKDRVVAEGLSLHPCYEFAPRCNCWLCVFAHPNVVRTYAEMHPELWEKACLLEDELKRKWKLHFAINDLMKQGRLL